MTSGCFIGIDQGSSSTKATAIDDRGTVLCQARRELPPPFRDGLRVEQDPEEILASVLQVLHEAAENARSRGLSLLGIGLSCQRSSCLAWNGSTGAALSPVLSWRDTRGQDLVKDLDAQAPLIFRRTGIPLTSYYAASKLRWLWERVPAAREPGAVLGTLSSFLCQRMTGAPSPRTDHTNAARTQLMDIRTLAWDREMIGLFGLERARLPEIVATAHHFGRVDTQAGPAPLLASIGDQQAALLGLGVVNEGQGGINYGTGGFLMVNTGNALRPVPGLMASVHYSTGAGVRYLTEGSVNAVGDGLEWLRANLGLFQDHSELEGLCRAARTGVIVFLGLNGTGAPHWERDITSAVQGLGRESTAADIVRGAVEGIAFFMADIAASMRQACIEPSLFTVSGGLASLSYLVEAQASLLSIPLFTGSGQEASARGAALLAGISQGAWTARDCAGFAQPSLPVQPLADPGLADRYRQWRELHRYAAARLLP